LHWHKPGPETFQSYSFLNLSGKARAVLSLDGGGDRGIFKYHSDESKQRYMGMAKLYGIGTSVYLRNTDGDILILKRAAGAAKGSWYIPGGGLDEGETTEECARRELTEETGLMARAMHLVAVTPMFAYGRDMFLVAYAAEHTGGEVTLSDEHEGFRWLCPTVYRDKYFSDESIAVAEKRSVGAGKMSKSARVELDAYLGWVS
jgi:8-oxo-dGTP diphosphatase